MAIGCPTCGEIDDLTGTVISETARSISCAGCETTWTRDTTLRCGLCGEEDLLNVPRTAIEAAGRGDMKTPMAYRDAYRCLRCGGEDVTSSNPVPLRPDFGPRPKDSALPRRPSLDPGEAGGDAVKPMAEVRREVTVPAAPDAVSAALASPATLALILSRDVVVRDGALRLTGPGGSPTAILLRRHEPGALVVWQVLDGPHGWAGTGVAWQLTATEEPGSTAVLLRHGGWKVPTSQAGDVGSLWTLVLARLREWAFTGKATPAFGPH